MMIRTWNAVVCRRQITRQVAKTRLRTVHFRIRYSELTFAPSGTMAVQNVDDVSGAANETEVDLDAATESHPAVQTGSHQDHVTDVALSVKRFR